MLIILLFCILISINSQQRQFRLDSDPNQTSTITVHGAGDDDLGYPTNAIKNITKTIQVGQSVLVRQFNKKATPVYVSGQGLGKTIQVKEKSCKLEDSRISGRITVIQGNSYTGRDINTTTSKQQDYDDDEVLAGIFRKLSVQMCENTIKKQYKNRLQQKGIRQKIIRDLTQQMHVEMRKQRQTVRDFLNSKVKISQNDIKQAKQRISILDSAEVTLQYRRLFITKINRTLQRRVNDVTTDAYKNHDYITTEFITIKQVTTNNTWLNKFVCDKNGCSQTNTKTNIVKIFAYQSLDIDQCTNYKFDILGDFDIMTVRLNKQDIQIQDNSKYFSDNQSYCKKIDETSLTKRSRKKNPLGLTAHGSRLETLTNNLIEATAQWGLIRHSIQALNFCYTQPFSNSEKYLLITRKEKNTGVISQIDNTNLELQTLLKNWVETSGCTPINPFWLFTRDVHKNSRLFAEQITRNIILNQQNANSKVPANIMRKKFMQTSCPTYPENKQIILQTNPKDFQQNRQGNAHRHQYAKVGGHHAINRQNLEPRMHLKLRNFES